jgi:hypothetical protein
LACFSKIVENMCHFSLDQRLAPHARQLLLLFVALIGTNNFTLAQVPNLDYQYDYTKITDIKFTKGLLDSSIWCPTDYVDVQPVRFRERTITRVFTDNHFQIEKQNLQDSRLPDWSTPVAKTVYKQDGITAYKINGTIAAHQSYSPDGTDPYSDIQQGVAAGQIIGNLPKFTQYDQIPIDSFRNQGYQIIWQPNGDLIISEEIHVIFVRPSVLQVEQYLFDMNLGEIITLADYQIVNGDTLLRKTLTTDWLELCSGACIQRETREVYINYDHQQAQPRSNRTENQILEQGFITYPNPFTSQLTIKPSDPACAYTLAVYSQHGGLVYATKLIGQHTLSRLEELPSGSYQVVISTDHQTHRRSLIKL